MFWESAGVLKGEDGVALDMATSYHRRDRGTADIFRM